jgi:hypothetical protein
MKRLLIITVMFTTSLWAQVPDKGELEMEIESIAEGNEENETDLIQLAENLQLLQSNPVEINFSTTEDLEKIPYLNVFQINNLLQYRKRTGLIYSPYELMAIKGFNQQTIEQILPYLSFSTQKTIPNLKLKNVWRYSRHDLIMRGTQVLEQRRGFMDSLDNGYLGSPQNLYLRYKWSYRNYLSVGLVAQQDAGEPFGGPYQNTGVDFIAGHVALTNYGNLKSLIIGDYQAQFGQGMALWSSLAFGKSAEAIEIKRYAPGFRPYTGSEENRFFRGAAATYRFFNSLDVSAFYSNNKIDANRVVSDSTGTVDFVSSLQTTGLHRTLNELEDKNANTLQALGSNLNYKGNNFSVGATAVNYQLQTALEPGSQLYQKFRFSGTGLTNFSVDANYLFRNLNIFAELAADDQIKAAGSIGLQSNPTDGFYLTVLYRNLDKQYRALFNAPFAESGNYGEKGTYIGTQWQLSKILLLKSYVDVYRFSWLRFGADAPSRGRDILSQLEFNFSRYFSGYIRLKNEVQQSNSDSDDAIRRLVNREKTTLRFHMAYSISTQLKMASRVEYAFYNQETQKDRGFVVFQDLRYLFKTCPLQLTARYAVIDVDSYDARIYAYENDITYAFSIPPYYGRSSRFYLLADYDIAPRVNLQARYAISTYYDRDEISSGNQLIEGNTISEVKLQLRVKF